MRPHSSLPPGLLQVAALAGVCEPGARSCSPADGAALRVDGAADGEGGTPAANSSLLVFAFYYPQARCSGCSIACAVHALCS